MWPAGHLWPAGHILGSCYSKVPGMSPGCVREVQLKESLYIIFKFNIKAEENKSQNVQYSIIYILYFYLKMCGTRGKKSNQGN